MKHKVYKDYFGLWDCFCCPKILVNMQKTRQMNSFAEQLEDLTMNDLWMQNDYHDREYKLNQKTFSDLKRRAMEKLNGEPQTQETQEN